MERIYFVAFCGILLLSNTVFGQVGSLAGIATDGYHPIPFAHISVASTEGKTVVTNMNGEFTINNIPVGVQTIVVSSIGFRNFTQKVEIEEGKTVKLPTISLKEDALGLNEVVVTGTMQEIYMINSPVKVEVIPMNFIQKSIAPTNIIESETDILSCLLSFK